MNLMKHLSSWSDVIRRGNLIMRPPAPKMPTAVCEPVANGRDQEGDGDRLPRLREVHGWPQQDRGR